MSRIALMRKPAGALRSSFCFYLDAIMSGRRFARLVASVAATAAILPLFLCADASAGDYSIAYAIDADGRTEVGKIETCTYSETCKVTAAGLQMQFYVKWPDHRSVDLTIVGPYGCCYSNDATDTFYLDIRPGLQRVPIYVGKRRMGNEFVLNKRFGVLYLDISELRRSDGIEGR